MVKIYSLSDPITKLPRYVGKTINSLEYRFNQHKRECNSNKNTHKLNWIRLLLKKDLFPTIELIDEVEDNEWKFWEQFYIQLYKTWGFSLTNSTEGGDGVNHTEEIRNKIRKSNLGKKASLKTRLKKSIFMKEAIASGRFIPPMLGKKLSKESIERRTITRLKNNNGKYDTRVPKLKIKIKKYKLPVNFPIYTYNLNGIFINEFYNTKDASDKLKLNRNSIINALNRGIQLKGYLFFKEPKVFKSYDVYPSKSKGKIYIFSIDKELLSIEDGMARVADKYGFNINSISTSCCRLHPYKEFYFVREKDLIKFNNNDLSKFKR